MCNRVLIIAEAGVNHNGDLHTAMEMVDRAKQCGVDIIKFQTFNVDDLVSDNAEMARYQKNNIGREQSQKEMLESLALSSDDFIKLHKYCVSKNIRFLSTPFDIDSIHFLDKLQDFWKVPSGEINDYPYLVEIARTHKPVILSTGMSTMDEIEAAIETLKENGSGSIKLMHCTTEYPAPFNDVNLNAINTLRERFGCETGYSDHTQGIVIPIAAVSMGATIIEKHFTLDRRMEGPDHKASLEPDELAKMVQGIRHIELAMGNGIKNPTPEELQNRTAARKSIVARKDITCGELLSEDNITTKRPGNGINPMIWPSILGTRAIRSFRKDEQIEI